MLSRDIFMVWDFRGVRTGKKRREFSHGKLAEKGAQRCRLMLSWLYDGESKNFGV
jgi:hypothetical protein